MRKVIVGMLALAAVVGLAVLNRGPVAEVKAAPKSETTALDPPVVHVEITSVYDFGSGSGRVEGVYNVVGKANNIPGTTFTIKLHLWNAIGDEGEAYTLTADAVSDGGEATTGTFSLFFDFQWDLLGGFNTVARLDYTNAMVLDDWSDYFYGNTNPFFVEDFGVDMVSINNAESFGLWTGIEGTRAVCSIIWCIHPSDDEIVACGSLANGDNLTMKVFDSGNNLLTSGGVPIMSGTDFRIRLRNGLWHNEETIKVSFRYWSTLHGAWEETPKITVVPFYWPDKPNW
jgi:hypothetical protein